LQLIVLMRAWGFLFTFLAREKSKSLSGLKT
jgi:hypothetical protein